jgi:hypothetical protein
VRKREGEFDIPWPAGPERRRGRDGRFIVSCPACRGSGRVVRQGSQVPVGCRLCWERGRVARIVAERFERQRSARETDRTDPEGPQDCPGISALIWPGT